MTTQQSFIDFATIQKALSRHDPISAVIFMITESNINMNHIDFVLLQRKSTADVVDITIAFG